MGPFSEFIWLWTRNLYFCSNDFTCSSKTYNHKWYLPCWHSAKFKATKYMACKLLIVMRMPYKSDPYKLTTFQLSIFKFSYKYLFIKCFIFGPGNASQSSHHVHIVLQTCASYFLWMMWWFIKSTLNVIFIFALRPVDGSLLSRHITLLSCAALPIN